MASSIRLTRDALYNLHELVYDIPGFIWKVTKHPALICVCGSKEILEEMDRVLLLDNSGQILSYGTTGRLGDFYVSLLISCHLLSKKKPCVTVAFLLHEKS